ncbi:unnamed protein product [Ectocarpus sp. CCAP 1310/34]|nr:unnamed protein product [Ectocarpus sp. CCAP 1310/34]
MAATEAVLPRGGRANGDSQEALPAAAAEDASWPGGSRPRNGGGVFCAPPEAASVLDQPGDGAALSAAAGPPNDGGAGGYGGSLQTTVPGRLPSAAMLAVPSAALRATGLVEAPAEAATDVGHRANAVRQSTGARGLVGGAPAAAVATGPRETERQRIQEQVHHAERQATVPAFEGRKRASSELGLDGLDGEAGTPAATEERPEQNQQQVVVETIVPVQSASPAERKRKKADQRRQQRQRKREREQALREGEGFDLIVLEACPTPVQEALAWMATATVGVLDIASVGPLVPVCQAFKALIEAAEGAAESQDKLQRLVPRCTMLTTVLIQHHRAVGPLAQVQKPMKDFIVTTNRLLFCHRTDLSTLADFEEGLRGITNDIALVDGLEHHQLLLAMHGHLRPPTLPDMAAVPRGAISLTDAHVSRPLMLERAIDYLTNTARGDAPCVLTGMAGGGKSVLASAVVRDEKVREHFSAGIFWWRVGRISKDRLHEWLEGLVLRVASASGTTPPMLGSVEEVTFYLKAFCADAESQRLVVLDDVWEPEVVNALQVTELQLLVTTRDRSVVSMPGECIEVGDMEEDEALEVLRVGCGAPKNLELPRLQALQTRFCNNKQPSHLNVLVDKSVYGRIYIYYI